MGMSYRELEQRLECVMQENDMMKAALKQAKNEYDILDKYYERAIAYNNELDEGLEEMADENVELFRENQELTNKLVESGKKIAELQGKLDKLTNILKMSTGRENW